MLIVNSMMLKGVLCLVCQQCHHKTRNEYFSRFQFRASCTNCQTSTVLRFEELYWLSYPLNDMSRLPEGLAVERVTICTE